MPHRGRKNTRIDICIFTFTSYHTHLAASKHFGRKTKIKRGFKNDQVSSIPFLIGRDSMHDEMDLPLYAVLMLNASLLLSAFISVHSAMRINDRHALDVASEIESDTYFIIVDERTRK